MITLREWANTLGAAQRARAIEILSEVPDVHPDKTLFESVQKDPTDDRVAYIKVRPAPVWIEVGLSGQHGFAVRVHEENPSGTGGT